jgi:UDP-N-acetylmuramoyl-L-alanyl-D-glutamate--2,6-diaminopimelate ligase
VVSPDQLRATRPRRPQRTPLKVVAGWLGLEPPTDDVEVTGLTLSSQRVLPGDLYAALPGARAHGASYAGQAADAGAVAILTDPDGARLVAEAPEPLGRVPVLVVPEPRAVLGTLAARVYGDPAAALRLVAVTGTQGKTTTTRLAELALQGSGVMAGVIGTVGTRAAGEDVRTTLTTPEAPDLHGLFAMMRERGVEACAMEVSSHALVMGRVAGVVFDVAVFTNLGRDHLDFHTDMDDYFTAKASLFTPERARAGLVNVDDVWGRRLVEESTIPVKTYSTTRPDADWRAEAIEPSADGSTFTVVTPDGTRIPVRVPIPGDFNVSNALAALAALAEVGYDPATIAGGMAGGGVPGRLERVDAGQDFTVVVDYAHKPDAVEAALATLRPLTDGQVIVVIGAGGDRDAGKRPVMGEIAARLADVLVVTDDNPRSEDPAAIRAAILAGARGQRAEVVEVGGRRAAIRAAIDRAGPGDIVLVAGKGHETGQEVGNEVHPFDDREVVREELAAGSGEGAGP